MSKQKTGAYQPPPLLGVGEETQKDGVIPVTYIVNGRPETVYIYGVHYSEVHYEDESIKVDTNLAKDAVRVVKAIGDWWNRTLEYEVDELLREKDRKAETSVNAA
jgi:hypothetical protein